MIHFRLNVTLASIERVHHLSLWASRSQWRCFSGFTPARLTTHSQQAATVAPVALGAPRILFFGGDDVSVVALKAIHEAMMQRGSSGSSLHVVCPTVTAPLADLVSKHKHHFPVARYCLENQLPLSIVDHPKSLSKASPLTFGLSPTESLEPDAFRNAYDIAVVVSFRYFLPSALLRRLPRMVNLHPSLLPKYRGASPIYTTMLRGEAKGGYSIIKILPDENMDTGDILLQESWDLPVDTDMRTYFADVTNRGAAGLCRVLFGSGSHSSNWAATFNQFWAAAQEQPNKHQRLGDDPFHAKLLCKMDSKLPFSTEPAEVVHNVWRAFAAGHHRLHPHCALDKAATPVGQQLLQRELDRLKAEKLRRCTGAAAADDEILGEATSALMTPLVVTEAVSSSRISASVQDEIKGAEDRWFQDRCEWRSDELMGSTALGHMNRALHIPAGSVWFPKCDPSVAAVKCASGWFYWKSGVLRNSTNQPVRHIRDGLAMKPGRLYPRVMH